MSANHPIEPDPAGIANGRCGAPVRVPASRLSARFRAYFKHPFLKQYEKFATFLRNELVSNNLADFHLKKAAIDHFGVTLRPQLIFESRLIHSQSPRLARRLV
jgi:hypothetical protein